MAGVGCFLILLVLLLVLVLDTFSIGFEDEEDFILLKEAWAGRLTKGVKPCALPRSFLSLVWNFFCPLLLAVLPAGVQAQLVNNGATSTLANVANNITGDVTVGTNGSFNQLVISNGALLEHNNGNLGFLTASANNSVLVAGPGSFWTNRGSFSVSGGFLTSSRSNRLVMSNSAALVCGGTAFLSASTRHQLLDA